MTRFAPQGQQRIVWPPISLLREHVCRPQSRQERFPRRSLPPIHPHRPPGDQRSLGGAAARLFLRCRCHGPRLRQPRADRRFPLPEYHVRRRRTSVPGPAKGHLQGRQHCRHALPQVHLPCIRSRCRYGFPSSTARKGRIRSAGHRCLARTNNVRMSPGATPLDRGTTNVPGT